MSAVDAVAAPVDAGRLKSLPACGVWSPVLVPVNQDLSVNHTLFLQHAEWLLAEGCHGLALFGTTSEANSFCVEERMAVLDSAIEHGLNPDALMVGTGCCAITDSIRLTQHALDRGCKKALMLPPFYYKGMSELGLHRSYATVIDRIGDPTLRVFLYHFPRLSGVPVSSDLVDMLVASHGDTIAGFKDSSGDWDNTATLLTRFPKIAVFPGSERFLKQGLEHGGAGCITATANVNPRAIRATFDACITNKNDASEAQTSITSTRTVLDQFPMVPTLKYLTARRSRNSAWREVRPPMVELPDENGQAVLDELAKVGALF